MSDPQMVPLPPNYPPAYGQQPPAAPKKRSTGPTRTAKRKERRQPAPYARTRQMIDQHPRYVAVAYNASAAAAGWYVDMGPWMQDGMTQYGALSVARGVWVGVGLAAISLVIDWKTHSCRGSGRPPLVRVIGWAGRIPLATAVLALALYGPDAAL